uniref:Mucin-2-like n=1 Tax=Crassostrea virginica TaxID=6565 RepID=A0A8B8BAL7_CRAVI|nr:mucin-2-like [Crassostrea virginica]
MCGLPGGIDTADTPLIVSSLSAPTSTSTLSSLESQPIPVLSSSSLVSPPLSFTSPATPPPIAAATPLPTSASSSSSTVIPAPVTSDMLLKEELCNVQERRKLIKDQQVLTQLQIHHYMLKIKQRDPFFDME